MEDANDSMLNDEIYALSAIFESDWTWEDNRVYSITLYNSSKQSFYFKVNFPPTYPSSSPPTYSISAPWLSREAKVFLNSKLEEIYLENAGGCIVFLWIEAIKEFIQDGVKAFVNPKHNSCESEFVEQNAEAELELVYQHAETESVVQDTKSLKIQGSENKTRDITIKHSRTIIDRKSVFQAHLAAINSLEETKLVLELLKENRKVAAATHNIMAYRLLIGNKIYHDYDDDGENQAGGNLLRILEILDVTNVIVVVSRWYGGTPLGSVRFKHINQLAKEILTTEGFVKKSTEATKA